MTPNNFSKNLKTDIPAGIVVFLVALPLCLGIGLASGAPLFSGVVAGIVGGIVIGLLSGSNLSVSGPAAGLTVIVLNAITTLGSFELFLTAVVLAGIIQVIFGFLRAGVVGHFFPSAVIKGMLSAIGLLLILKQIPHGLGDDKDYVGDSSFYQPDGQNTFTEIILAIQHVEWSAFIICLLGMVIMVLWEKPILKKLSWTKIIPGPLVAVLLGVVVNQLYKVYAPEIELTGEHLVQLPEVSSFSEFIGALRHPDLSQLTNKSLYFVAFTIAIIASLETLLSLDAVDKLDPLKRIAPQSRELKAQGVGNIISGIFGGIPVTSVIVRSSANVTSGGLTKTSAVLHGFLLLIAAILFPRLMNMIPLSVLAAILLMVGYKLTKPSTYKEMYNKGQDQFIPYVVTIIAILFTDLLIGIVVGIVVGLLFVIKTNFHQKVIITRDENNYIIKFPGDVSFLNKAFLRRAFEKIPNDAYVLIDGTKATFIDEDIMETIWDFQEYSVHKNIQVELKKSINSQNRIFQR